MESGNVNDRSTFLKASAWFNIEWQVASVIWNCNQFKIFDRERSGLVVEYSTRDWGATGSSLTSVTVLWSLSKTHLSQLRIGSTQEDPSLFNWKIVDGT